MAAINDLKASLVSKLESVSSLQYVYDHRVSDISGYPCAIVSFNSWESEYADNQRDLRYYQFSIQIIQERTQQGFGIEKGERVLGETIDDVLGVLDADGNFSNSEVLYSNPFSGDVDASSEYLSATIEVTMRSLVNVTI